MCQKLKWFTKLNKKVFILFLLCFFLNVIVKLGIEVRKTAQKNRPFSSNYLRGMAFVSLRYQAPQLILIIKWFCLCKIKFIFIKITCYFIINNQFKDGNKFFIEKRDIIIKMIFEGHTSVFLNLLRLTTNGKKIYVLAFVLNVVHFAGIFILSVFSSLVSVLHTSQIKTIWITTSSCIIGRL